MGAVLIVAVGFLGGCDNGESLVPGADDVGSLTVTALDMQSIQIRWNPVASANRYVLERRSDLQGPFEPVLDRSGRNQTGYTDRGLEPNTIYGYRLRALTDLGDEIGVSTVAGARTAPEPGIEITVQSVLGGESKFSTDSNGYQARVRLGDLDDDQPIDINGSVLFQPLAAGTYQVTLEDLAPYCTVDGQAVRNVPVTATGLNTIAAASFVVNCRDQTRGRVTAVVQANGDTTDADGFRVALTGLASDQSLPDSLRAVVIKQNVAGTGGTVVFDNVRAGSYSLTIESVAPVCTVAGTLQRDGLAVTPLGDLSETYDVTCVGSGGSGGDGPYLFRANWEPDTAQTGTVVKLTTSLDLGVAGNIDLAGYQFTMVTAGGVVRLDSIVNTSPGFSFVGNVSADHFQGTIIGSRIPGVTSGIVPLADLYYTVIGATGRSLRPQVVALTFGRGNGDDFTGQARREIGLFTVGTKVGSSTNQPPVAVANGPYTGTAGSPVAFSAAGSGDSDGTITSYGWDFGDGQTGTGQSPTHTYGAAGTYTARLTVTDNRNATATSQATVTITTGGGNTTPFTWDASFGPVNPVDNTTTLTMTLDLTADISETAGVEALQDFVVDSVKWNPDVLEYQSFGFSSGTGSLNFLQAINGRISFRGTVDAAKSRGTITIATAKFRVKGANGTQTTTKTAIKSLVGTAGTGAYDYASRTKITEGTFTVAGGGGGGGGSATVMGTVTKSTGGGISGATVQVSGGFSGTTAAAGTYSIAGVPSGSHTVSVASAGLPSGCTAPAAQTVTVPSSGSITVNFTVNCGSAAGTGSISGTIAFAPSGGSPSIVSALVTATPANQTTSTPIVHPDGQGNYTISNVPITNGNGIVKVSGLPGGCTPTSPQVNYSGMTAGGSVTAPTITITCPATTNNYKFTIAWGAVSAGKITMTAKIDMTTRNDPANNGAGADKIGGFQAQINYPTTRLSAPACTAGQLTGPINVSAAGKIVPVLTNIPAGASGNAVSLFSCTFDITGTGPTPITITPNSASFGDPTGSVDFTAFVDLILNDVP